MDEFDLIKRYFDQGRTGPGVIVGIGDDAAVLRPESGRDLVSVVDTIVEGIHFPRQLAAFDVGYRVVVVNLSDIAAMGARPRWMTLALTLANDDPDWLDGFARGLFAAASPCGLSLVGGDTTRGSEIVASVQITGDVMPDRVLTRAGARPGDVIYVSGSPGDAAAGLAILKGELDRGPHADYLVARFTRPSPRLVLGESIAGVASAAIDVSDGLFTDLDKLLAAGGVAGTIDLDALPISAELAATVPPEAASALALGGGDDYEICFTADASAVAELPDEVAANVTAIGRVAAGRGLSCMRGGEPVDYHDPGYRHFR